jgi:predicted DNA-binding ArsR family transcriptional regulator
MRPEHIIKLIQLRSKYRALSEIEECFPKNSKHAAAILVNKKMNETLFEIELIENYEQPKGAYQKNKS